MMEETHHFVLSRFERTRNSLERILTIRDLLEIYDKEKGNSKSRLSLEKMSVRVSFCVSQSKVQITQKHTNREVIFTFFTTSELLRDSLMVDRT